MIIKNIHCIRLAVIVLTIGITLVSWPNYILWADTGSKAGQAPRVLTIAEGMQLVLKDSRLVKIELSAKDIAFEDSVVALSGLLPHLNANVTKVYNQYQPAMKFGSQNVFVSEKNPISWGVDVYQTLFDFGKSISRYQASTKVFDAHKANVETIKRMVALEFVVTYFDLLETEKMIKVAEKEVESLASYLHDMEHLYEEGSIVKNDLLPAKVKLADAKQRLIVARNMREVMNARTNTILTLPIRGKIEPRDITNGSPELPEIEEAFASAELKRPEILFFNNMIRASVLSERAKTVENLPTVFLDGGYSYVNNSYQVNDSNLYLQIGAKLNFYDGGASGAEIMKERYKQAQLKEQKNKLLDDIKFEVEDSYTGATNAREKLLVAQSVIEQAEENVRVYRVKYNNGAATSTDVLEAITLQTKADINFYSADYELKRYYAKLMHAMGIELKTVYKEMEDGAHGSKE